LGSLGWEGATHSCEGERAARSPKCRSGFAVSVKHFAESDAMAGSTFVEDLHERSISFLDGKIAVSLEDFSP
jgi:hypothetical protein